ncbi:MAG: hypothetical protein ACO4CI_00745 [Phycisphaerales bacterium]
MTSRSPRRPRAPHAIALAASAIAACLATAQWDAEPLGASQEHSVTTTVDVVDANPAAKAPPTLLPIASSWRVERGELPLPVIEAAVVVRERHLAVLGGLDASFEATTAIQIHDPRRGWLPIGSQLATPRADAACVELPDGRVLLFGGFTGSIASPTHLEDGERLDPLVAGSSRAILAFGESLEGLTATPLAGDRVLVAAGSVARIYDASLDRWSEPAALDIPRRHHAALALDESHVLLVGGEIAERPNRRPDRLSATLVFVPEAVEPSTIPAPEAEPFECSGRSSPPWGLREFAVARHPRDGRWLIAGGLDPSSGSTVRETWWLDADRAAVFRGPAIPHDLGACRLHIAELDRGLVFLGGEWRLPGARGEVNASWLLLEKASREMQWRSLAPLPASGSRRMLVDGPHGLELLGGYAFIDAESASAEGATPGPRFDRRRYRLSIAPLASGD